MTELSLREYRDLREAHGGGRGPNGGLYQRCRTCGHCEYAGAFCSWCTTGDYVLEAHLHGDVRRGCPLPFVANLGTFHHRPGASSREAVA
jgi:hypothetical protein